jgi:hypothetical protein
MRFSTAVLTLTSLASMTVLPETATVRAGKSHQFTVTTTGLTTMSGTTATAPAVQWSVEPAGVGTVDNTGLYTAPAQVLLAQRVKVKATTTTSPVLTSESPVDVVPDTDLTFTLNNNGLDTVIYQGVDYNYKYGEGLVQSVTWGEANTFLYGPPCTRSLKDGVVAHSCTAGPVGFNASARYSMSGPSTLSVDLTVTNHSATERLGGVAFSVMGLKLGLYDVTKSRVIGVNSDNPVGMVNFGNGRFFYWFDTPGDGAEIRTYCGGSYQCKFFASTPSIGPGETRTIRVTGRYTADLVGSLYDVAPEAYVNFASAFPMSVRWPDRRPIMAWWIAEGAKRSALNPRGYFQDALLNASDPATFRTRAMSQATRIRDLMNARPVRPQGLIIWDLEGQEFIHPTTYIGDPRVFSYGYAAEMDAVADDVFRTFREAGYRVGVTIRPSFMEWGTALPATCVFDKNNDFKSYYVKVDNPYHQRFHACSSTADNTWTVIADGNGGQMMYQNKQIREVTDLLKSKIRYAYERWGATLFYMDSAVWSGGTPLEAAILRELQQTFPDILIIPEQERMETMSTAIPYSDSRIPDAKIAPISWRWAFPTGAFAVAIGDCQGTCWDANVGSFQIGQKIGDIAIYAQPTQMSTKHLPIVEEMIQKSREEASKVTVTDASTLNVFQFQGDVMSQKPYPVKLRVYFSETEEGMAASELFCEAGQWMGETSCTLPLDGKPFAEVRYYDFTNTLVHREAATRFRQ